MTTRGKTPAAKTASKQASKKEGGAAEKPASKAAPRKTGQASVARRGGAPPRPPRACLTP